MQAAIGDNHNIQRIVLYQYPYDSGDVQGHSIGLLQGHDRKGHYLVMNIGGDFMHLKLGAAADVYPHNLACKQVWLAEHYTALHSHCDR